jgi:CpXC motif protein
MSLFKNVMLPCPACGEQVEFEAVSSVNADRRPDLRDSILAGTFQQQPCPKCKVPFRLDPQFMYLDVGRGQWIAVHPFGYLGDWESLEERARASFERSYGAAAPQVARDLGAGLQPRMAFGWHALAEKILAREHKLNDVDLELTKMSVLRDSEQAPLTAETEMRLVEVKGDSLIFDWVVGSNGEVAQRLTVSRALYDEVAGDRSGWQALRDELDGRIFVDMQRLMLPVA